VPELGFIQLCSDRRFHTSVMKAFESAAGLAPDRYWIEARPGGAPSWADETDAARLAYDEGAAHMAWAAHGDECGGFPGTSNAHLREKVAETVRKRAPDFPLATHYGLFAYGGEVELVLKIEPTALVSDL
jgi:hypothetical protein